MYRWVYTAVSPRSTDAPQEQRSSIRPISMENKSLMGFFLAGSPPALTPRCRLHVMKLFGTCGRGIFTAVGLWWQPRCVAVPALWILS